MIYIFFMMWRLVIACGEAGCTVSSPERLAMLSVVGAIELVLEIKGVLAIMRKKDD